MLYYYKDEDHQDKTVKVSAMKRMFRQLGTPDSLKREIAVPNAGEHVIGSYITSKDLATVENECMKFGEEVLRFALLRNIDQTRDVHLSFIQHITHQPAEQHKAYRKKKRTKVHTRMPERYFEKSSDIQGLMLFTNAEEPKQYGANFRK